MQQKINNKINFAFFGTPDVASETLEILKGAGYLPSLIVTSPDKPQGRKMIVTPPPVKVWAEENGIPYIQPEKLVQPFSVFLSRGSHSEGEGRREEKMEKVKYDSDMRGEQNIPEFFIVVAYGKIMPETLINMPEKGSVNIHYSLLPKYRGASPVESAILNGDTFTGVTIQKMEFKMDSGPILAQEKVEIFPNETAPDLRKRLIKIGAELLVKILPDIISSKIKSIPQNEPETTHCKKIKKEDGLIDLNADAKTNFNKFRAYAAWPRTFFFVNNKRIIITKAKVENNTFIIETVLPEGKKEIKYEDFNLRHGVD